MHHARYCIFNKQYSPKQYEELVPKIISQMAAKGEWGEFFPIISSPFGYNKTTAQLYYPMERNEVLRNGWKWDDSTPPNRNLEGMIKASDLPDEVDSAPNNILQSAIICEVTGKPFKITPKELQFYQKNRLPLPRRCPDQRHIDRFHQRNLRQIYQRSCAVCSTEIWTTYKAEQMERVACEECYLQSIY